MASSPLQAPTAAAGQHQSRLYDMQKKFQQRHLATLAAVKGAAATSTSSTTSSTATTDAVGHDPPIAPARRFGGAGVIVPQQKCRTPRAGSGKSGSEGTADGARDSAAIVQVDVKGKVRQLFAERNQQQHSHGQGYIHHQQQRRQRRRSLTGRDRSRPLRPLFDADNDPLCKTVCFTAPSLSSGASAVRGELLALFGRLPNLGGSLWSESFRANNKMKTAQSAPELKWLLDAGGGGPAARVAEKPQTFVTAPAAADDQEDDIHWPPQQLQQKSRPIGRINSKTTTTAKKPQQAVAVNSNGRAVKKPTIVPQDDAYDSMGVTPNRLLLPPVVQPTVINALAAGSSTASAVASVGAAATAAAGVQRPVIRAAKIPGPGILRPLQQQQQQPKPVAPSRQRSAATTRHPVATQHRGPSARPQPNAIKPQMSADRGPPAKGMARCPLCARDFASDRLPKHEEVCRRTREKDRKRKVFDTSRKRLETVAAEAGVDVSSLKKKGQKEDERAAEKLQKKKDAWRRKHEQLVRNVRAARAVQRHLAAGGNIRDLPPELDNAGAAEPDEIDSDLVKCPHCNRTFNEASAERHIPLCAERQRNAAARLQNKKR